MFDYAKLSFLLKSEILRFNTKSAKPIFARTTKLYFSVKSQNRIFHQICKIFLFCKNKFFSQKSKIKFSYQNRKIKFLPKHVYPPKTLPKQIFSLGPTKLSFLGKTAKSKFPTKMSFSPNGICRWSYKKWRDLLAGLLVGETTRQRKVLRRRCVVWRESSSRLKAM